MEVQGITDLYQASWLVVNGCALVGIECIPAGGALSCRMDFKGIGIAALNDLWHDKKAVVNLWAFRSAYHQVNSYVHQAKKSFSLALRRVEE